MAACCCVRPRTGAFIVSILDLILGTIGLVFAVWIILQIQIQILELSKTPDIDDYENKLAVLQNELLLLSIPFMLPSVLTCLVGLLALISVMKGHAFIGLLAIGLNVILVVSSIGMFLILFILGVHWLIIILPDLVFGGLLQIYFLCVLNDFRVDLKAIV